MSLTFCFVLTKLFRIFFFCLGKNRHIRLYPLSTLDGHDTEPIKMMETKGCIMFAVGSIHGDTTSCLCVAVKRHVVVYELNRTKFRHLKIRVSKMFFCVVNRSSRTYTIDPQLSCILQYVCLMLAVSFVLNGHGYYQIFFWFCCWLLEAKFFCN